MQQIVDPRNVRRDARERIRIAASARLTPRDGSDENAVADQRAAGVAVARATLQTARVHAQRAIVHELRVVRMARSAVNVGQGGHLEELQLIGCGSSQLN